MNPSQILKTEEAFMLLLSYFLFTKTGIAIHWFFIFFLVPDLSMLGYLAGPRIGAFFYNLGHHKALAIALYLAGMYFTIPVLQASGLIMFGHSSFDRILGYGLKYPDSFQNTHLGRIGKEK